MNTISINAEPRMATLQAARRLAAIDLGIPRQRPPAAWLPVPVEPRVRTLPRQRSGKTQALLMPSRRGSGREGMLLGLLTLAAAVAIGYGFYCLVELVQNWALFGAGVERFIQ